MRVHAKRDRDKGCDLYPSCLDCSTPVCKFEEEEISSRANRNLSRDRDICRRRELGASVGELSVKFQLSPRSVQRILRKKRREVQYAIH